MDVKSLAALVFFSVLIEGMVEYVKLSIKKNMCPEIIAAVLVGVGISFAFHLNFFAAVGITTDVPYVANILTGIILARGSNYMFDLIGKFSEIEKEVKKLTPEQEENMAIVRPATDINEDVVDHQKAEGVG